MSSEAQITCILFLLYVYLNISRLIKHTSLFHTFLKYLSMIYPHPILLGAVKAKINDGRQVGKPREWKNT